MQVGVHVCVLGLLLSTGLACLSWGLRRVYIKSIQVCHGVMPCCFFSTRYTARARLRHHARPPRAAPLFQYTSNTPCSIAHPSAMCLSQLSSLPGSVAACAGFHAFGRGRCHPAPAPKHSVQRPRALFSRHVTRLALRISRYPCDQRRRLARGDGDAGDRRTVSIRGVAVAGSRLSLSLAPAWPVGPPRLPGDYGQ